MDLAAELYGEKPKIDLAADLYGEPAPVKLGQEGFSDALRSTLKDDGWAGRNLAGVGSAAVNAWEGLKGVVGQSDQNQVAAQKIIADEAPVGNLAGNVAMLAPTAAIPGANTVTGAATIGGLQGALLTPGDLVERARAALFGAGAGAAGAKAGQYLTNRLSAQQAEGAANASRNAVMDATWEGARDAGYKIPPSTVNPNFVNNTLESIAGKAAIKQDATIRNQDATDALMRKGLGMADDAALSEKAVADVIENARGPYQQVAALKGEAPVQVGTHFDVSGASVPKMGPVPPTPAQALEALKQSRSDANELFKFYKRNADPETLAKAKASAAESDVWEMFLEETAKRNGKPELINSLREARKTMAKAHTVDRALNTSTGEVVATDLGRMIDKGAPLTGELATAARFGDAFPQFAREGSRTPTPDVSALKPIAALMLGIGGGAAGGPAGVGLAALPFARDYARKLLLSNMYQRLMANPNYAPSLTARAGGAVAPFVPAVGMSLADLAR